MGNQTAPLLRLMAGNSHRMHSMKQQHAHCSSFQKQRQLPSPAKSRCGIISGQALGSGLACREADPQHQALQTQHQRECCVQGLGDQSDALRDRHSRRLLGVFATCQTSQPPPISHSPAMKKSATASTTAGAVQWKGSSAERCSTSAAAGRLHATTAARQACCTLQGGPIPRQGGFNMCCRCPLGRWAEPLCRCALI